MEFLDNTGHIFSLPSYNEKPIGYEFEEQPYIFWIDANYTDKLSVDNYYAKVINILFKIDHIEDIDEYYINKRYSINIEIENSDIFSLIKPIALNDLLEESGNIKDYVEIIRYKENNDKIEYSKNISSNVLTNDDLLIVRTTESVDPSNNNFDDLNKDQSNIYDFLLIPIYILSCAKNTGTWISNILIHITDNETLEESWTPISIGGEYDDECEELVINGRNMGIDLPRGILKAIYQTSYVNSHFDSTLYNLKLKEYLFNYMGIRGEIGNFNSVINSLKWFGYGDRLNITKLLQTDNQFKEQYLHKHFDILNNILNSFKSFKNTTYIAIQLALYKELDETYPFVFYNNIDEINDFFGENKPKLESLLDKYVKVNVGHDLDIINEDGKITSEKIIDREKYWYWKPYFDFSFNELGLKLACLKYYYEKYFLPIHLSIHSITTAHKVFANDIKFTIGRSQQAITENIETLWMYNDEVKFIGNGIHYFTKQIHWLDQFFNEYNNINSEYEDAFYLNDTCTNIPIKFINNKWNSGYFNCTMLLERHNSSNTKYEYYIEHNVADIINQYICTKTLNFSIDNIDDLNEIWFAYSDKLYLPEKEYKRSKIATKYSGFLHGFNSLTNNIIEHYYKLYKINDVKNENINALNNVDVFKLLYKFIYNVNNKNYIICLNFSDLVINKLILEKSINNYIQVNENTNDKTILNIIKNLNNIDLDNDIKLININKDNSFIIDNKKYYLHIYKQDYNDIENNNIDVNDEINISIFSDIFIKINTNTINIGNIHIGNINENNYKEIDISNVKYYISNDSTLIYESHFNFYQNKENIFENFVIYPKMLNIDSKYNSKNINYWINTDYTLHLCVNNKWYKYDFKILMPEADIDLGTIRYKYWLNDNNYILNNILKYTDYSQYNNHILAFVYNNTYFIIKEANENSYYVFSNELDAEEFDLTNKSDNYTILNEDTEKLDNFKNLLNNLHDVTKTSLLYKHIDLINKNQLMDYIYNISSCYISNFNQILSINGEGNNKSLTFNSFMHHPEFVEVNNINWDIDVLFKQLKYNLNNNIKYIDKSIIDNNEFYYYLDIYNNNKHQKIYIHKDNIGYDIKVPEEYFDSDILYILQQKNFVFILSEDGENTGNNYLMLNGYFISSENDNYDGHEKYIDKDDKKGEILYLDDFNGTVTGIEINSSSYVEFIYDKDKNAYINNGNLYYLKESLHYNLEHIFEHYDTSININYENNKYLNSLHIFDLYKKVIYKENVLIFNNNIDMTANGLIFKHGVYDQYAYDENTKLNPSVRFDVFGMLYDNYVQTTSDKTIDNYSVSWNKDEDKFRENNQDNDKKENPFFEEIKKDIFIYYQQYDKNGEPIETPIENKFTTEKFTNYKKNIATKLGYDIFRNEQEFINYWKENWKENNVTPVKSYRNPDLKFEIKNATEQLYDVFGNIIDIDDLYIVLRNHNFKVEYLFEFVEYDTWLNVDPTIDEFTSNNKTYYVKVNYQYYDINRVYNKEIIYNGDYNNIEKDSSNNYYFIYSEDIIIDGDEEQHVNTQKTNVYLNRVKSIQYIDKRPSKNNAFISRIQNPAMYWFNVYDLDKDNFEELELKLNILERYWGKIDNNINTNNLTDTEKEKGKYIINGNEYNFKNFLMKDITGLSGKFELYYRIEGFKDVAVVVGITDKNGNSRIIETSGPDKYAEFTLTGDEQEVKAFFICNDKKPDGTYIDDTVTSIYPYIFKIIEKYEKLDYLLEYEDEEYLTCNINNVEYKYGYNRSQNIIKLYEDFFEERFTIYDVIYDLDKNDENDKILTNSSILALGNFQHIVKINKIRSLYRSLINLDLNFDYDFYLMHNDKYWYGIFISKDTINNANSEDDILLKDKDKEIYFTSKDGKTEYMLKYVKSDKQFLINRMEYVTSYPKYHFKPDDIIVTRILNNDRLPINVSIGSKWNIKPLSIGMNNSSEFDANAEMTIISLPMNNNEYSKGYYNISLQYSLDRDIQHQNKKAIKFRVE